MWGGKDWAVRDRDRVKNANYHREKEREADGQNGRRLGGGGSAFCLYCPCLCNRGLLVAAGGRGGGGGGDDCSVVQQRVRAACMHKVADARAPWDLCGMQVEWCRGAGGRGMRNEG